METIWPRLANSPRLCTHWQQRWCNSEKTKRDPPRGFFFCNWNLLDITQERRATQTWNIWACNPLSRLMGELRPRAFFFLCVFSLTLTKCCNFFSRRQRIEQLKREPFVQLCFSYTEKRRRRRRREKKLNLRTDGSPWDWLKGVTQIKTI